MQAESILRRPVQATCTVKTLYIAKFSEAELKTLGRLFDRFRTRRPDQP
ncbi:MAG: hypothetical protein U1E15_05720 [Hyphomicrobiales bacterium]